jgi:feruloyl-CoA synthase
MRWKAPLPSAIEVSKSTPQNSKEEPPLDSVMQAPFKPIDFLSRDIKVDRPGRRHDRAAVEPQLKPYESTCRRSWRSGQPRRRTGCGWRSAAGRRATGLKVSYGEAKRQVDAVTQALLDRGFGPDKAVMILSSNSIEFALLSMAAMQARAPLAPVSPAYSVMSRDHAKLKYVFDLIRPGLVFVQNGEIYAEALADLELDGVLLVHVDKAPPQRQSLPWSELVATTPTDAVQESIDRDRAQTVGKFLFTSGSTGMPKAVINTQEMMCANLAMSQMARVRKARRSRCR